MPLTIRRGTPRTLQILRRPRHLLHLLFAHRHGGPSVALGCHGRAGRIVKTVEADAVPHEDGGAISGDEGLAEEEVGEVGRSFGHFGVPHDPIRLLAPQIHPRQRLLKRPHPPLRKIISPHLHAQMRKHRFQHMSRLNNITLIEPRSMPRSSRMSPQHQFKRIPRHDMMDESSGNTLKTLLRRPRTAPRSGNCWLEHKGCEFFAVHPLFLGQSDRSIRGNSHAVLGIHRLDGPIDQQLGLCQKGLHVLVIALPGILRKVRIGNVPVGGRLEVGGLGAHLPVIFGVGVFEIEVSPCFGVG
mmetsp:Transcript_10596/g.19137  ORF Transcript_10596/g.19137 Transcript_10596/m.19137 type:complete len:299 (-) Transcript_10596:788-1684(-)